MVTSLRLRGKHRQWNEVSESSLRIYQQEKIGTNISREVAVRKECFRKSTPSKSQLTLREKKKKRTKRKRTGEIIVRKQVCIQPTPPIPKHPRGSSRTSPKQTPQYLFSFEALLVRTDFKTKKQTHTPKPNQKPTNQTKLDSKQYAMHVHTDTQTHSTRAFPGCTEQYTDDFKTLPRQQLWMRTQRYRNDLAKPEPKQSTEEEKSSSHHQKHLTAC